MSCREQERSCKTLCINANCREAKQSTGRGAAANLGVVHHCRAVTLHSQMQVLPQAVTQCKPKLMTAFRQLVRKPHCFSAETLPVKYYLDRKAAAGWGMLICATSHKHQRLLRQVLLSTSVDITEKCLQWNPFVHETRITHQPGAGRTCTERHQLFKEWEHSLDLTNVVQDSWAMESFTLQDLLPTRKTGKQHHVLDSDAQLKWTHS